MDYSLLNQLVSIEITQKIQNDSSLRQMLPSPFRWVFKPLYRAFSPGVFHLQKKSIPLALAVRDIHTCQIYHVSIDLWGYTFSTKA